MPKPQRKKCIARCTCQRHRLEKSFEAAIAGDEVAKEILSTGKNTWYGVGKRGYVQQPEAIILLVFNKAGDLILKPTREHMEENLIKVFQNKVKILVSHLKESDAAILGASALAWDIK